MRYYGVSKARDVDFGGGCRVWAWQKAARRAAKKRARAASKAVVRSDVGT